MMHCIRPVLFCSKMKRQVGRTGLVSIIRFCEIHFMYICILKYPINLCYSECLKCNVLIVLDFQMFGKLHLWTGINICHFIALELMEEDIYM